MIEGESARGWEVRAGTDVGKTSPFLDVLLLSICVWYLREVKLHSYWKTFQRLKAY